jgi:hypothetical protein
MAEDDLFAVFGYEEDDEEETDTRVQQDEARELVSKTNERLRQTKHGADDSTANEGNHDAVDIHVHGDIDLSTFRQVTLAWDPPLYLGPLLCVSSIEYGGGRGFVASRDLPPGTLILVERPLIVWPQEQIGSELGLVSIRHVLEKANAQKIIHDLEDFHPTKDAVDQFAPGELQVRGMIETLEAQLIDQLPAMVELSASRKLTNRNGTELDQRDIVRLLLALRYNGFQSGVFLHHAMLNHSCYPNSVKFVPTGEYSEVRTTRMVKAGVHLTISYLPRVSSHATRRHHLWEQHFFDIVGQLPEQYIEMERVGNDIPVSYPETLDKSAVTFRVETATSEMEDHFQEIAASVVRYGNADNQVWEEGKALELSSLELYRESLAQLQNEQHLLLIPCLRLHLDVCDLLEVGNILSPSQHILLLLRVVASSINLIKLQTMLYGQDHFDLARSYNELAQAIAELLSKAPSELMGLGIAGMSSFQSCSAAEHRAKREFERIRDLYPRDVEQHIQNTVGSIKHSS